MAHGNMAMSMIRGFIEQKEQKGVEQKGVGDNCISFSLIPYSISRF